MIYRLIFSRVVSGILTVLAISIIVFWSVEVIPGDVATRVLGRYATRESIEAFRRQHRLDRPAIERCIEWLFDLLRGDFGESLVSQREVRDVLGPKLVNTIWLSSLAFAFYLPQSLILAAVSAIYQNRQVDYLISFFVLVGLSIPEFALGTVLILLFSVWFPMFPAMSLIGSANTILGKIRTITLPALTLSIVMSAYAFRMLRGSLVEVLNSEYVRMARLKGLRLNRIFFFHALPNAIIPTLNVTALNLAYLVGGVVVVEKVFTYPGLGSLLVDSISLRDMPVIESVVFIVSGVYVISNLIADLLSLVFVPRLRETR